LRRQQSILEGYGADRQNGASSMMKRLFNLRTFDNTFDNRFDSAAPAFASGRMRVSPAKIVVLAPFLFLFAGCHRGPRPYTGWPAYGGGPENIHYSALSQINRANVARLRLAWTFDSGDAFPGSEMECNPIVVKGVLYATTPKLKVVALDAATGRLIWRFNPNKPDTVFTKMRNRGVTWWSDGHEARIFVAVREYLYSLDAATGKPDPAFGEKGRIDLRDDLGRTPKNYVSMTSPGVVYKDLLIVGSMMAETLPNSPGDIRAYDARTGRLRWAFHTIPHPGEFGYDTWPREAWTYSGAANDWAGLSLDARRGLVFAGTGSAAYDFYGANRVGDDLFANSEIALDANTGRRVWHFQTVRHDLWDRDLPAAPVLVTVRRNGRMVDAVAQTTKSGYVYLFERTTGRLLFPVEYRRVPASPLDGEVTAPTQPFPLLPRPFARQALTAGMLTRRTPAAHDAVAATFRTLWSAGQFVPPSRQGTIIFPGFDGGAEWGGPAFDPETQRLYVNSNEMAWILKMLPTPGLTGRLTARKLYLQQCGVCHRADRRGAPPEFPSLIGVGQRFSRTALVTLVYNGSGRMPSFERLGVPTIEAVLDYVLTGKETPMASRPALPIDSKYINNGYQRFLDPDGYPAVQPPWGTLNAINLNTGKIEWRIPLGNYPELAARGMGDTGSENYGGPVVTAGGLLFIAATSFDKKIRAFDKASGKLLWQASLPAAGNATPAVYDAQGREYVAVAAGGGKSPAPSGGSIVAFALPQ
jgi:quinoprotein glucose dehydrogenase